MFKVYKVRPQPAPGKQRRNTGIIGSFRIGRPALGRGLRSELGSVSWGGQVMRKNFWLGGMVLAVCCMPAWAAERTGGATSRPFVIVRRCVERLEGIAERSVQIIAHQAMRGVRLVNHLQGEGMVEEAAAAAERATAHIETVGKNAGELVDRALESCLTILTRIEAPQAGIDMVNRAAEAAKVAIESAQDRSVQAIQDALAD